MVVDCTCRLQIDRKVVSAAIAIAIDIAIAIVVIEPNDRIILARLPLLGTDSESDPVPIYVTFLLFLWTTN